eukprot:3029472-Amphidinium_carterae.1
MTKASFSKLHTISCQENCCGVHWGANSSLIPVYASSRCLWKQPSCFRHSRWRSSLMPRVCFCGAFAVDAFQVIEVLLFLFLSTAMAPN